MEKKDLRSIVGQEMLDFLARHKQKPFRAKQINQWLWERGATNIRQMKNLPGTLLDALEEAFEIPAASVQNAQTATDGTSKVAFEFHDGQVAEGVYIPSRKRVTACVSSQTGCNLNCAFCATGQLTHGRNLTAGEIFDQVVAIKNMAEEQGNRLTNIVYMGMGEPLLNYDNVLQSVDYITGKPGLEMSPSRITVSTAGIVPGIMKLADDKVRFHLAISLHSAIDETRNRLMPINKKYPLDALSEAIQYFHEKTGERITFEYLMLRGVNDSLDEAAALAKFCKSFPVKINLIEYNPVEAFDLKPSTQETVNDFVQFLEKRNMIVNVRRSKGQQIDAACGQLANRNVNS
ncbi:dual-specificity RNA methyltransferase RlmN [Salinivirga cyanobacteriivorans]